MNRKLRIVFIPLFISIIFLVTACQPKEKETLNEDVTTLNGRITSTQTIFSQAELTVVNVWSPSCADCKQELTISGDLNQEYAGMGVQVIGLIKDVDTENESSSLKMIEDTGANYTHILDSDNVTYKVPTTLYIDQNGKLLGTSQKPHADISQWRDEIESYHQKVCTGDHPAECAVG